MKQYTFFRFIGVLSLFIPVVACSSEPPVALKAPLVEPVVVVPDVQNNEKALIPELLAQDAGLHFSYNAVGSRDPFRSIIERSVNRPKALGSLPPLQRNEISDLRLRGIIWGAYGPRAIINTPNGNGYTVRIGTQVGYNHGVVKRITQKKIIIEETLLNIFGEPKKRKIVMELHPQKEG